MLRGARIAVAFAAGLSCGGEQPVPVAPAAAAAPATVAERMLAMLPQGAQVVVELDLARLRANPVVGEIGPTRWPRSPRRYRRAFRLPRWPTSTRSCSPRTAWAPRRRRR